MIMIIIIIFQHKNEIIIIISIICPHLFSRPNGGVLQFKLYSEFPPPPLFLHACICDIL